MEMKYIFEIFFWAHFFGTFSEADGGDWDGGYWDEYYEESEEPWMSEFGFDGGLG